MRHPRFQVSGETITHRELWHAAKMLRNAGPTIEKGGAYATMAACVFVYFAFEGLLNFIGPQVAPKEWKDEKAFFSKPPYRGTLGKLDFVAKELGCSFDKGVAPYQTLRELEKLRHAMVHPRRQPVSDAIPVVEPFQLLKDEAYLSRVMSDAEATAEILFKAAQNKLGSAFDGAGRQPFGGLHHYHDVSPRRLGGGA